MYTLFKISSYALAWIVPIVIIVGVSRWLHSRAVQLMKQRIILLALIPVAWFTVLGGLILVHTCNELVWYSTNSKRILTEESIKEIGDYPNIFVSWLVYGWIPIVVGLTLSVPHNQNKEDAQQVAPRNR